MGIDQPDLRYGSESVFETRNDSGTEGAFMTKKVADQIAGTLATVGIERIYGVVGDSL
jgi:hypothetical protein